MRNRSAARCETGNVGPDPATLKYRESPRSACSAAGEVSGRSSIAQGLLGFLVFFFLRPPPEMLHLLYGFAVALAMPLAASVVRDRATEARGRAGVTNAKEETPETDGRVIEDQGRSRAPVQRENDIHLEQKLAHNARMLG